MNAKSEKNYAFSMMRFAAMIMVIFCHTFQQIGYTLGYSRHLGMIGDYLSNGVQIFLALSGYLYGSRVLFQNESRIKFVLRNCKKILLDYYIYAVLIIIPLYCIDFAGKTVSEGAIFNLLMCSGYPGGGTSSLVRLLYTSVLSANPHSV